jgi:hypothetical protein
MIRSTTTKAAAEMEKMMKNRTNAVVESLPEFKLERTLTLGLLVLSVLLWARLSLAQETGAKTFSSAGEASHALFLAVRDKDEQSVGAILGAGKELTSSNDEVEDQLERDRFSQKYQEMHRLVQEPDGETVLYIGAENWPFPIPLISKNGRWHFDPDAGAQEILFRKVGENETTALAICQAFAVTRDRKNTNETSDDPITRYSQYLVVASNANTDQPVITLDQESEPFHGYYFRIVKTRGLSLIAYPADYRSSGVLTFIVTQHGMVQEKDLGPETPKLAPNIRKRNSSWRPAE